MAFEYTGWEPAAMAGDTRSTALMATARAAMTLIRA
jgi:hypothetical protein